MERLAKIIGEYLNCQIAAGAQAVQIFDSWAGCLTPSDYEQFMQPYTKAVIDAVTPGVPVINFSTGTSGLLKTYPRRRRRCHRPRLAHQSRRRLGHRRPRRRRARQPRSGRAIRFAERDQKPSGGNPAPRRRPSRPYFQSRPRRPAGNSGRSRDGHGRRGARTERKVEEELERWSTGVSDVEYEELPVRPNTPIHQHSIIPLTPPCHICTRPSCSSPSAARLVLKKFARFWPA